MNKIARIVALSGLTIVISSLVACSVTRKRDGTITITESGDPLQDGDYRQVNIGGKCYLSNGIYCIPCNGGKALTCEDVRRVLGDEPWQKPVNPGDTPPGSGTPGSGSKAVSTMSAEYLHYYGYNIAGHSNLVPSETMEWSVKALGNGLDADSLAQELGITEWQAGVDHSTVFSLNSFDSEAGTVDITYLTAWGANAPVQGIYTNGVEVEYYHFGGNPNDNARDVVAVRISGPIESVATVAANEIERFNAEISTEDGDFAFHLDQGQGSLTWNGVTVWSR